MPPTDSGGASVRERLRTSARHYAPPDELWFMHVLRTLAFANTTSRYDRHLDAARDPRLPRVVGRTRMTLASQNHPASDHIAAVP